MQTKGKKKIIDNAGALQKKYAWKSEKMQDTKKAPQDTKKQAAACPYAKKCGGCDYQGMSYEQQLQEKQTYVRKNIGDYCKVLPIIGMENPYHYRNKVHAVFDVERRGKHANGGRRTAGNGHAKAAPGGVISGVYKAGTHEVINIDSCEIEDELSSTIIRDIRGLLHSFKIKTYDEDTGYGLLRHVLVRRGFHSGEVMVVLVLGSPILPSKNNFVKALRKLHPEITTVVVNINDKQTSMVLGEKETVIYGKGYIEDTLCGCTFRISPKSFYQVNPVQTEILYTKAIEYAGLTGKERIVDAYCGIGTIGLIAASKAKEVISVELNRDAVRDAVTNAKRNDIKNVQFYNADAGQFMVEMAEYRADQKKNQVPDATKSGKKAAPDGNVDVVFMDPPRAGSDEAFLSSVIRLAPKRVVYISCNPETLARDLKYLTKHGYQAKECQPVDLFPWTKHVETVVLLSHKKPDGHINVKVEFGEGEGKVPLDNIAKRAEEYKPKERVTYKMIKEYIEAKYGFKVHTAYIAEVKRDLGLPMYDAPNAVEELKQPRKHPTAEKVEAIKDALKHFEVI